MGGSCKKDHIVLESLNVWELCGLMWPSASPKHPFCVASGLLCLQVFCTSLWQHIVRHGGVCLYSFLIHACLWMPACSGLPPSSPLALLRGSWAWLWRGALVLWARSAGPQDPNTWWACRVPGRAHKSAHCQQATHCCHFHSGWWWATETTRWHV